MPRNRTRSRRSSRGPVSGACCGPASGSRRRAPHSPPRSRRWPTARATHRASVWISLASVALAGAIGVPLAFLFEWLEFPGRKTLGSLIALPAVLPPFVGVIAFLFLYGESGFVARAVQRLLGLGQAPWRLQGAGAILLVHAYSMYVYFYLFTRAGLAKLDASMLEAAQALGAGRWETLRRVTLPLIRPALAGVALGGLLILRHTEGDDILVALGKGTAPRRRPIQSVGGRALATAAGW